MESVVTKTPGTAVNILCWVLQILAALAFLAAGGAKLAGVEQMVKVFDGVGLGQWFRYVTGTIELGSAIALLIPGYAAYGTLLLIPTMICAIYAHMFVIGGSPGGAALLLFICCTIFWLRRHQISALNKTG